MVYELYQEIKKEISWEKILALVLKQRGHK